MPANLTPAYRAAEDRFRAAKTVEDKLVCLEEMLRIIPKHKGTDKLQGDIKARIAKLRRQPGKKGGATGPGHMVHTEGAGQVALVGPPNAGKSALVSALTHAHPKVADYPFTTREPVPGMMAYEDIAFQLVDLPPVCDDHVEGWVFDLIRHADLLWLVAEVDNSLDELKTLERLLDEKNIRAYPAGAEAPVIDREGWITQPALFVVTGLDRPDGPAEIEILRGLLDEPWPVLAVSATAGDGLDDLRRRTCEALDIVRVYTKEPGKPADRVDPFTFRRGATIADLARIIHKDVLDALKFARIWGTDVFDGQTVQRDHVLSDGDVVEIHANH